MNLVVLPILAACVFAFGYRYFGKLIDAIMGNKRQYNTAADHGAEVIESSRLSLWARFGTLGTPLLMVGSLYSLRAGWAPVFLWILLVATTIGALSVARRLRPVLPSPKPSLLNDGVTIAVSAALALLWAGLAAHSPHAVLGFMVFFFSAPRLATLLLSKNRLEQVGGGLFIIGLGLILAALGSIAPIGLSGPITLALGPWHLHTHSGALIAYAGLFLVILHKNRRGALTNYPTYGAIGSLLLACAGVVILVAVLLIHPTLTIPRLTTGSLGETIPILACAIPFGVALAPQPTRSTHAIRPQRAYLLTIFEGISGVGALVCLAFTFHNTMAWHDFFLTSPGPISLLRAAAAGGG